VSSAAIIDGRLVLHLHKDTYQRLGLTGRKVVDGASSARHAVQVATSRFVRSPCTAAHLPPCVGEERRVEIDIRAKSFRPGKALYTRVCHCLGRDRLPGLTMDISWAPSTGACGCYSAGRVGCLMLCDATPPVILNKSHRSGSGCGHIVFPDGVSAERVEAHVQASDWRVKAPSFDLLERVATKAGSQCVHAFARQQLYYCFSMTAAANVSMSTSLFCFTLARWDEGSGGRWGPRLQLLRLFHQVRATMTLSAWHGLQLRSRCDSGAVPESYISF
jgi:ribonuclease P (Rpp40) subunit